MDDQSKNLILATALSFLVILAWFLVGPMIAPEWFPEEPVATEQSADASAETGTQSTVPGADTTASPVTVPGTAASATDSAPSPESVRIPITSDRLEGALSLSGGRIDELRLKDYRVSIDAASDIVTLLRPQGQTNAYYGLFGWSPGGGLQVDAVPGPQTEWLLESGDELSPGKQVTLVWDNGAGLVFRRTMALDDDYMFTVTQSVANQGAESVRLAPYGQIVRHGEPDDLKGFFIIHEGAIRQTGSELNELSYDDLRGLGTDPDFPEWGPGSDIVESAGNGWVGFTDHYWMTTLIADGDDPFISALQYDAQRDTYRATARLGTVEIAPGATGEVTQKMFAGAKEWATIRAYEREKGIYRFIDSIDWGWFYFLTKPIFWLLHQLNLLIGNMGWSIIALTLIIKAAVLPLAFKSYVSMAKMKELQPEMEKIKERAGDDRQKLQTEMMELYKKEKVNPASGCLPILLQIPIFFSLYKVIFVTIELRHAPWLGPFQDLSAPDPTSILNLYGLLPIAAPEPGSLVALIFIGILPLILGISMWLQQKLNPAPTDPTQAMIFAWMPWIFMFMLGSFASGLIIYWIANNTITFVQQYAIMRSQGYKPDVFGNIVAGFKRGSAKEK